MKNKKRKSFNNSSKICWLTQSHTAHFTKMSKIHGTLVRENHLTLKKYQLDFKNCILFVIYSSLPACDVQFIVTNK